MKLVSQLLKYTILLLAILFVVGVITFVAMFVSFQINPNGAIKIFGYSYYKFNTNETKMIEDTSTFSKIEVTSKYSYINIMGSKNDFIKVEAKNKMMGIAKLEKDVTYGYTQEVKDDTLKITINEPKGIFVNKATASLVISIPKSICKDIVVNSEKGAVSVGNNSDDSHLLNASNITINASNNTVNVLKTKNDINDITINSNNNYINIDSNINGMLTVNTKTSTLKVQEVNTITVNATNPKITGDKINSGLNLKSSSGIVELKEINGDVNLEGNIKVNVKAIIGSYTDTKRTSSSLYIGAISGNINTTSTSGTTTIEGCLGNTVEITSKMGNIKVKNVIGKLNITTESGLCDVEFAELGSANEFNFSAKNGSLKATNINRAVNINIQNDGVCALDLTYKKIKGNNVINAQKGKVNVVAPIQKCVLTVNTSAKKDISYADIVSTENIDANLILGATADTQDKLTISSSTGAVTLKALVTE